MNIPLNKSILIANKENIHEMSTAEFMMKLFDKYDSNLDGRLSRF